MMPVGPQTHVLPPTAASIAAANKERRDLRVELADIDMRIKACKLNDPLTHSIRDWHCLFDAALVGNVNLSHAKTTAIALLHDILKDTMPLKRHPLDDETYYCSDGNWVGGKALACYLHHQDPSRRGFSPFSATSTTHFTVQRHPLARYMVNWLLVQGNPVQTPPEITQLYDALIASGNLPTLPLASAPVPPAALLSAFQTRVDQLRAANAARSAAAATQGARQEADIRAASAADIASTMGPIETEVNCSTAEHAERARQQRDRRAQQMRDLKAETAAFRKDAEDLRNRNVEIRAELDRMEPEVAELHRDTAKLEISVNETRAAIAERNAEASSGLLTALVVVVVCVVATYAIAAAAPAVSSAAAGSTTVTATPVQGGGAMLNFSTTFATW